MAIRDVSLDVETYGEQPIKDVGGWRYAMDSSCELLCLAYSIDGGPVQSWRAGDPDPDDLLGAIEDGALIHAWNAAFEYVVMSHVAPSHWPRPKLWQMRCSMALAAYHSLPLSLEKAGAAVGAAVQKDKEGVRLIRKFCVPRKPTKNNPSTRILPEDDPEDFEKLVQYCVTDVRTEMAIVAKLPLKELPGIEQDVYELDLRINRRGVKIDRPAAEAIIEAAAEVTELLEDEAGKIMGGGIKTTQRAAVMEWAADQGFELENYQAGYIRELIKRDDLPPKVHRVLEIREALAKTSVTKYGKMVACAGSDNHVRGSIQYYGAQRTGRFAGRLLQVHNLPRGTVKGVDSVAMYAAYLKAQDWMLLFDKPMEAFSSLIRSMIVAPDGKVFFAADFSNIEGRGVAWLAGQKDMIAQFAAGDDLYKHMAATIFGTTYHKVDDDQRWVGKQAVLGCFAPETLVVTNRGAVPIVYVRPDDLLWDGVEWVSHDGVIDQGVQDVIEVEGIKVTPDHGVYVDEGVMVPAAEVDWARAHAFGGLPVVENPSENCLFYRELFSYNPATGELRHRERDRKWFVADWSWKKWNREYAGQIAGVSTNTSGHKGTSLVFGRQETQHRIIWEMVYGQPAENDIDHVNGVKTDNRLINLRAATRAQNVANSGRYSSNTTGFDGVAVHTCRDGTIRWTAACGGYVGLYDSPEEAARARDRAAVAKYGPYARLNFSENRDQHVYDILNAGPRHRFAIITAQGVDIVTNCGYGMGAQKFLDTCTGYGNDVGLALAKKAVKAYRDKNQKIVKLWYATERAAKDAVRQPGTKFKAERLTYLVKDGFLWCRLPSGRTLAYHSPRLEDDRLTYMGVSQTTNQWSRQDTYGGKLVENCLGADTEILTDRGWVAIVDVRLGDLVWDGVEWVSHDGLAAQGWQEVIELLGVKITPDHEVLVEGEWERADEAKRLHGEGVWDVGRDAFPSSKGQPRGVADDLRVWGDQGSVRPIWPNERNEVWESSQLRMLEGQTLEQETRVQVKDEKPCLWGVERNGSTVHGPIVSSLAELRRSRDRSRPEMDELLGVREGHEAFLEERHDSGPDEQRRGLRERELPMGLSQNKFDEPEKLSPGRHSSNVGENGHPEEHTVLSVGRVPVYDLLNAGPRTRFLVRSSVERVPFIVHNCVQAIARDVLVEAMLRAEAAGYPIVMTVHDEVVSAAEPRGRSVEDFVSVLCEVPDWAEGFPVAAAGWSGDRYRKD